MPFAGNSRKKGYPFELRQYDSAPLAIEDLLNGRIQAALMDELPADDAISKGRAVKSRNAWQA